MIVSWILIWVGGGSPSYRKVTLAKGFLLDGIARCGLKKSELASAPFVGGKSSCSALDLLLQILVHGVVL